MTLTANNKKLRAGLRNSLPEVDHAAGDPERNPEFTYVPPSHARALDPNTSIVEGIRGAGKSFWWSHLSSEPHKKFVSEAFPEAKINPRVDALKAFGAQSNSADAPSVDVLASLTTMFPPRTIWRAVCAHKIGLKNNFPAASSWKARVEWVYQNPEAFDAEIVRIDNQLEAGNQTRVILFDALDRLADDWQGIRPLAKGLLQVAQDLRSTQRIRFKIFVRPDMLQDKEIVGFPDASKLLARKAQLAWRRADLYALLFQCLGNDSSAGAIFRKLTNDTLDCEWIRDRKAWVLPPELRSDEKVQEAAFVMLAGRAMASGASGHKRGRPYTWLVNHLQDGLDQVSPRSFFSAIREAATQTREDNAYALGFKEIQLGVQSASQIRVNEIIYEDYPWVDLVMKPLRGKLSVPCAVDDIATIWKKEKTLGILSGQLKAAGPSAVKLPPQSLEEGSLGVLKDLEALGIVKQLNDKRIQMPDVYRIAFGLGRRGGVKPLK